MLLFRSEEHVARWCARSAQPQGAVFSLETAWALARAWYAEDRTHPEWRRRTKEEGQQVLAGLGLSSPFWQL
jgi:hypothetical protein